MKIGGLGAVYTACAPDPPMIGRDTGPAELDSVPHTSL